MGIKNLLTIRILSRNGILLPRPGVSPSLKVSPAQLLIAHFAPPRLNTQTQEFGILAPHGWPTSRTALRATRC